MKKPFYSTHERLASLSTAAHSWLGTPFRQGCRVKGAAGGVDCVGLNLSCYEESGFVMPGTISLPPYELERYEHSDTSQLEEWFRSPDVRARMQLMDRDDPLMDGDTFFIRHRRAVHHVGLWVGGRMLFTMRGQGAMILKRENLEFLGGELRSVFRPTES
jgi:cell wall-associated NlpC family hydrolase